MGGGNRVVFHKAETIFSHKYKYVKSSCPSMLKKKQKQTGLSGQILRYEHYHYLLVSDRETKSDAH